jgi:putative sporulation protein YtaF
MLAAAVCEQLGQSDRGVEPLLLASREEAALASGAVLTRKRAARRGRLILLRSGIRSGCPSIAFARRTYRWAVFWFSVVLIAVVSNLDNLAAGVAFGMRGTRIAVGPNVVIAAVTMAATAGAISSGGALRGVLPQSLAAAVGASIICAIGVWTVAGSIRPLRFSAGSRERGIGRVGGGRYPLSGELAGQRVISLREALGLGVVLALNNAATGVGAGVAGVSALATTLLAGALSLICVGGGSRVGRALGRLVGDRRASLLSGVILLGVGAAIFAGAG